MAIMTSGNLAKLEKTKFFSITFIISNFFNPGNI
jgi:hypothetical protein